MHPHALHQLAVLFALTGNTVIKIESAKPYCQGVEGTSKFSINQSCRGLFAANSWVQIE